jgi:hypothetical protein
MKGKLIFFILKLSVSHLEMYYNTIQIKKNNKLFYCLTLNLQFFYDGLNIVLFTLYYFWLFLSFSLCRRQSQVFLRTFGLRRKQGKTVFPNTPAVALQLRSGTLPGEKGNGRPVHIPSSITLLHKTTMSNLNPVPNSTVCCIIRSF